jgi:hypothetical protein
MDKFDDFVVKIAEKSVEYLPESYKSAVQGEALSIAEIPTHILREAVEVCIKDIRAKYNAEHGENCEPDDEIDPM